MSFLNRLDGLFNRLGLLGRNAGGEAEEGYHRQRDYAGCHGVRVTAG